LVVLKDLWYLNKDAFKKSTELLMKNWGLILTGFIYIAINIVLSLVISTLFMGVLRILSGIILALATASMLSNYLYLLQNIIRVGKFDLEDCKRGFTALLRKVYSVLLIGWLASVLYSMILSPILGSLGSFITMLIPILIFLLLNALPESLYQKFYDPWETVTYAFEFIKENWLEWFIPNTIFIVLLYILSGRLFLDLFSINFSLGLDLSLAGLITFIIGQVIFSFMMLYRGVLFEELSKSTRRKRIYMRDLYK